MSYEKFGAKKLLGLLQTLAKCMICNYCLHGLIHTAIINRCSFVYMVVSGRYLQELNVPDLNFNKGVYGYDHMKRCHLAINW